LVEEGGSAYPNRSSTFDPIGYFEKIDGEQRRIVSSSPSLTIQKSLSETGLRRSGGDAMNIKDLIEYIAKALVDHPEQVKVSEIEGERTSVLELYVAKEDLGKIIGKQGRTAKAIRVILGATSAKLKKHFVLEIIE